MAANFWEQDALVTPAAGSSPNFWEQDEPVSSQPYSVGPQTSPQTDWNAIYADAQAKAEQQVGRRAIPTEPEPEPEPEEESGALWNAAKLLGERGVGIVEEMMQGSQELGESVQERYNIGGITWEGLLPEYRGLDEYREWTKPLKEGDENQTLLGSMRNILQDVDLDTRETTYGDFKTVLADDNASMMDKAGTLASFIGHTTSKSMADMGAMIVSMPFYGASTFGRMLGERLEATGKDTADAHDIFVSAVGGGLVMAADKFGLDKVMKGWTSKGVSSVADVAKRAAAGLSTEAVTEGIQEAIEYASVRYDLDWTPEMRQEMTDGIVAGMIGGGGAGGAMSGGIAAVEYGAEKAALIGREPSSGSPGEGKYKTTTTIDGQTTVDEGEVAGNARMLPGEQAIDTGGVEGPSQAEFEAEAAALAAREAAAKPEPAIDPVVTQGAPTGQGTAEEQIRADMEAEEAQRVPQAPPQAAPPAQAIDMGFGAVSSDPGASTDLTPRGPSAPVQAIDTGDAQPVAQSGPTPEVPTEAAPQPVQSQGFSEEELAELDPLVAEAARSIQSNAFTLEQSREGGQGRPSNQSVLKSVDQTWSNLFQAFTTLGRQGKDVSALRDVLERTSYNGKVVAGDTQVTGGTKNKKGNLEAKAAGGSTQRIQTLLGGEAQTALRTALDSEVDQGVIKQVEEEAKAAQAEDVETNRKIAKREFFKKNKDFEAKMHAGKKAQMDRLDTQSQMNNVRDTLEARLKDGTIEATGTGRFKLKDITAAVDEELGVTPKEDVARPAEATSLEDQIEEVIEPEATVETETPVEPDLNPDEREEAEAKAQAATKAAKAGTTEVEADDATTRAEVEAATFEGTEVEAGGPTRAQEGELTDLSDEVEMGETTVGEPDGPSAILMGLAPAKLAEMSDADFKAALKRYAGKDMWGDLIGRRNQGLRAKKAAVKAQAQVGKASNKAVVVTKGKRIPTKRTPGKKVTLGKKTEPAPEVVEKTVEDTTTPEPTSEQIEEVDRLRAETDKREADANAALEAAYPSVDAELDALSKSDPDGAVQLKVGRTAVRGVYKGMRYTLHNVRSIFNLSKALWVVYVDGNSIDSAPTSSKALNIAIAWINKEVAAQEKSAAAKLRNASESEELAASMAKREARAQKMEADLDAAFEQAQQETDSIVLNDLYVKASKLAERIAKHGDSLGDNARGQKALTKAVDMSHMTTAASQREIAQEKSAAEKVRDSINTSMQSLTGNLHAFEVMAQRQSTDEVINGYLDLSEGTASSQEIAELLTKHLHPSDPLVPVVEKMVEAGVFDGDLPITMHTAESWEANAFEPSSAGVAQGAAAVFDGQFSARGIHLNEEFAGTQEGPRYIVHEMAHFALDRAMETNPEFNKAITGLYHRAKLHTKSLGGNHYGLTNKNEFITESLTNPDFQKFLNGIRTGRSKTSLWTKLVNAVSRMLNMPVEAGTALSDVMRATENAMLPYGEAAQADAELHGEVVDLDTDTSMTMREYRDNPLYHKVRSNAPGVSPQQQRSTTDMLSTFNHARNARSRKTQIAQALSDKYGKVSRGAKKVLAGMTPLSDYLRKNYGKFIHDGVDWVKKYERIIREKVRYAREQHRVAQEILTDWREFEKAHPERAERLSALMQRATMNDMHVDKTWWHKDNAHLRKPHAKSKNKGATSDAAKDLASANAEYAAMGAHGQRIYQRVRNFYQGQRNDMRTAGINHVLNTNGLSDANIDAQFAKMSPGAQTLSRGGVANQKKALARLRAATTLEEVAQIEKDTKVLERMGDHGASVKEAIESIVGATTVPGPYFPLRRFGENAIDAVRTRVEKGKRDDLIARRQELKEQDPTAKVTLTSVNTKNNEWQLRIEERVYSQHESMAEAEDMAALLKKEGFTAREGGGDPFVTPKVDSGSNALQGGPQVLHEAVSKISTGDAKHDVHLKGALSSAFMDLMVEKSMRHASRPRLKVAGASFDMKRGFADRAFAGGWAVADLRTAWDHEQALKGMRSATRNAANQGENLRDMGDTLEEIRMRDEKSMQDRATSKVDNILGKTGFFWFLTSPSYSMINATQPWLVAVPYLAAKYGGEKSATAELFRQTARLRKLGMKRWSEISKWKDGSQSEDLFEDIMNEMSPNERTMLQDLFNRGIIDSSFAQELFQQTVGEQKGATDYALDFARASPAMIEVINRVSVANAAYNLSKANKNLSHDEAVEAAADAVLRTQFDYSDLNKPRYFKMFPGLRSIMMFKMYAIGMYQLMGGALVQSITGKGTFGDGRKTAAKTFAYLSMSHIAAAGVMNGMFEPIKMILDAMMWAMTDEDDEWQSTDDIVRDAASDLLGAHGASIVTGGLPRVLGIDISTRVGPDNLLFADMMDQRSYQDWWAAKLISLLGPIVGMSVSAMRTGDYFSEGQYYKGIEASMPKMVKDAMRAARTASGGITDFKGDVVREADDISKLQLAISGAVGIGSAQVAEAYGARTRQKRLATGKMERAKTLRGRWHRAPMNEKLKIYREEIIPYNLRHTEDMITLPSLFKGTKDKMIKQKIITGGYHADDWKIDRFARRYAY